MDNYTEVERKERQKVVIFAVGFVVVILALVIAIIVVADRKNKNLLGGDNPLFTTSTTISQEDITVDDPLDINSPSIAGSNNSGTPANGEGAENQDANNIVAVTEDANANEEKQETTTVDDNSDKTEFDTPTVTPGDSTESENGDDNGQDVESGSASATTKPDDTATDETTEGTDTTGSQEGDKKEGDQTESSDESNKPTDSENASSDSDKNQNTDNTVGTTTPGSGETSGTAGTSNNPNISGTTSTDSSKNENNQVATADKNTTTQPTTSKDHSKLPSTGPDDLVPLALVLGLTTYAATYVALNRRELFRAIKRQ